MRQSIFSFFISLFLFFSSTNCFPYFYFPFNLFYPFFHFFPFLVILFFFFASQKCLLYVNTKRQKKGRMNKIFLFMNKGLGAMILFINFHKYFIQKTFELVSQKGLCLQTTFCDATLLLGIQYMYVGGRWDQQGVRSNAPVY